MFEEFTDINSEHQEFNIWLQNGVDRGWVTDPFCNTHEGDTFMTDEEMQEWEEGGDPCQVVIKLKI
jgi:hypothetical protein